MDSFEQLNFEVLSRHDSRENITTPTPAGLFFDFFEQGVYVIDYMRTQFVCTLSGTICEFLAINNFARIDAYRARIVIAILCIVSDCPLTVMPELADTRFHQSFVTMMPFSCVIMGEFLFSRKLFANGDCHLRTDICHPRIDIQVELAHYSNRDLYLLTGCASK